MGKARDKFKKKKEDTVPSSGLAAIKNDENELLATDNEAGAPAPSNMFESVKTDSNVDYTDGGLIQ